MTRLRSDGSTKDFLCASPHLKFDSPIIRVSLVDLVFFSFLFLLSFLFFIFMKRSNEEVIRNSVVSKILVLCLEPRETTLIVQDERQFLGI